MNNDRAKAIRSALLTAYNVGKAGGGKIIPHGDPKRDENLAKFLEGNKAPPVLYHGTPNWEGTAYNPNQPTINNVNNMKGFYADTNPETASSYALDVNKIAEMAAKRKRGENLDPSEMGYGPSSQVLPVHMAIKKPFVPGNSLITKPMLDTYAAELKATNSHLSDYSFSNWAAEKVKNLAKEKRVSINALNGDGMAYQRVLKAGGYDGLKDGTAYVAFEPTQIKSAVGNRGTFDPSEPDITKAGGGKIIPIDDDSKRKDAFNNLASQQRGNPELAMMAAQELFRGGVMSHALEHIGDLTHRMSEKEGRFGSMYVRPKVESVLRSLKSAYGFSKEHLENMAGSKISPESENVVLNQYANEHSKLPVYNKNQELGRNAAIALGKKDFDTATQNLEELDYRIKSGVFDKENLNYDPNYEKLTEPDITKAGGGDVEPDDFNPRAVIGGNNPPTPVYYSALKQGVANAKQMQATPQDWKAITAPGKLPGVRQEEIDYSGLHDFLDKQQGQVSKDALLNHLEQNPAVKLNEVWKSGTKGPNRTKFGTYALPGGTNYQELAMTLPPRPEGERNYESPVSHSYGDDDSDINRLAHIRMNDRVGPNGEKLLHIEELQSDWHQTGLNEGYSDPEKQKQIDYHNGERRRIVAAYEAAIKPHQDAFDAARNPHQDAFYAAKDREREAFDADLKLFKGHKVVQDEFHAALKPHHDKYSAAIKPHQDAFYAAIKPHQDAYDAAIRPHEDAIKALGPNKGVPDGPYKDTKDWTALALKRVMRHAANNNYDGITWTTGDQQADRYDLSKQVSSIKADQYNIADENGWRLDVKDKNDKSISMPGHYLSDDELADHVGKDMAKKIIDSGGGEFHGLDLKVGGEGMRKYYDKIVPSVAKELAKAHGVKVGKIQMKPANKPNYGQWAYDYQQENGSQNQGHLDNAYDDFVDSKEFKGLGELHHIPVTSSMKKSAKLFKSGGMVEPYKHTGVIHPARTISGVHIRHETHGTPIFTGGKHGR